MHRLIEYSLYTYNSKDVCLIQLSLDMVWGGMECKLNPDIYLDTSTPFSLPLIQEGQLSVSGERMCTILVNRLED